MTSEMLFLPQSHEGCVQADGDGATRRPMADMALGEVKDAAKRVAREAAKRERLARRQLEKLVRGDY